MTTKLVWLAVVIASLTTLAVAAPDGAAAKETIADGGFESASLPEEASTHPVTYDSWVASRAKAGGTITPVTSPVLSGTQAAEIDTRTASFGRFVYQDLREGSGCFTWTFEVYRGQGKNTAELLYSWRGGDGPLKEISVLTYGDDGISFTGWDASTKLSQVLSLNQWHEVTIQANADKRVQTLLIDGQKAAELTARDASAVADTIIIGDVAGNAFQALYTYDDVSLNINACQVSISGTPAGSFTPNPAPAAALKAQDTGSSFPWWIIVLGLVIILLLLFLLLYWLRRSRAHAG